MMKILDLSLEERPREKLLMQGARNLSNAQLLAIFIRSGIPGQNAIDVARDLLQNASGSLETLAGIGIAGMQKTKGVGKDKAVTIAAAIELGRRLEIAKVQDNLKISGPEDVLPLLKNLYTTGAREECWCLYLKRSRKLLGTSRISEGGETLTELNVKETVKRALELGAAAVLISHNHPSGNSLPSTADIKATKKLRQALETFEISLLDHIIVSDGGCYSFAEDRIVPTQSSVDLRRSL